MVSQRKSTGPELIPIQRSAGLYLVRHGDGDDQRFARLFRETWRRIPLGARRQMVSFWRDLLPGYNPVVLRPRDSDDWSKCRRVSPRVGLLHGWRTTEIGTFFLRAPKRPETFPLGHDR